MIQPEQRTQMADYVRQLLGPTLADVWWRTPNPMLGGVKPYHMILMNREDKLYNFIMEAKDDNQLMRKKSRPASEQQ